MMYDSGYGYGSGYDVWGFLFMVLMMLLVIVGVIVVVRYFGRDMDSIQKQDTPMDLLKKRYAKGEIDKKEFDEKRKDLSD